MAQSAILNKDYILSKTGYTEEEIDQLEKLDLSNLDLTSIEPDAFLHFHSLKELHLNNNLLTELHSDVFKPLINLEKLYLDHNELTELHPFLFKGLTSLKIVHIFSNKFAAETIDLYLEPNVQVFIFKSGPEENENDDLFNNITDVNKPNEKVGEKEKEDDEQACNYDKDKQHLDDEKIQTIGLESNDMDIKESPLELENEEAYLLNDQTENYESFSARDDKNYILIKETDETDSILNEQNENDYDQISVKQVQLTILQNNLEKMQREYNEFLKLTEEILNGFYLQKEKNSIYKEEGKDKIMNLSAKNFGIVHNRTFQGFENLTCLKLNNNAIYSIHSECFQTLANLESLFLNHNQLAFVHQDTFKNLKNLRILSLENNQLSNLNSDIFRELERLEQLKLNANQLRKLSPFIFKGLKNLKKILMHNNLLHKKETLELFIEPHVIETGLIITFKHYDSYLDQNDKNSIISPSSLSRRGSRTPTPLLKK